MKLNKTQKITTEQGQNLLLHRGLYNLAQDIYAQDEKQIIFCTTEQGDEIEAVFYDEDVEGKKIFEITGKEYKNNIFVKSEARASLRIETYKNIVKLVKENLK